MRVHGALVREQGVTFGILVVRESVLNSPSRRGAALNGARVLFPGVPVVLMSQDVRGTPTYTVN